MLVFESLTLFLFTNNLLATVYLCKKQAIDLILEPR